MTRATGATLLAASRTPAELTDADAAELASRRRRADRNRRAAKRRHRQSRRSRRGNLRK